MSDPLQGRNWTVDQGDVLSWLSRLPDDYADMLFTSPPYEAARTYSIGFDRRGQDWVDWMAAVVKAAAPKVRGLIAVNCEGQTRNYKYSCVPFLLMADLHRAGLNLRKPIVFHRVGIPGSGGPDWLRNDWEPIVCVTRPGRLPWSDNTACGAPNKWGIGGALSYRTHDGRRIGGRSSTNPGDRSHAVRLNGKTYRPPKLANPGNIIKLVVGGGRLGHALAHENEAPFPLALAEFFVKSFCPPGGVVIDPFCGSGTTGHAAFIHGRRFVGCDVRESQVELSRRRLSSVTPLMFQEGGLT